MSPDPYRALADAIQGVVEAAVARALTSAEHTDDGSTAVMVSIPEAASRLGLGQTKVRELIAEGRLDSVVVDRRRLIPVTAIATFGQQKAG